MGKTSKFLSKYLNYKLVYLMTIIFIVIQPFIDLDYLMYDFLNQFGLPRLSTIIRFVILPVIIILFLFLVEKNKKRFLIIFGAYGFIVLCWFIVHCIKAGNLYDALYLTQNFEFNLNYEIINVYTLIVPIVFSYIVYSLDIKTVDVERIVIIISLFVGVSILLSNIFTFGYSTYQGYTKASIFSWFSNIYDIYTPKNLASKFFFLEGNTIGILMFMVLPLIYYFYFKSENIKKSIFLYLLIVIQSFAMYVLSTRVATYGAILICVLMIIIWLIFVFLKKETFSIAKLMSIIILLSSLLIIYPHTPAYINQKIDNVNDTAVLNDDYLLQQGKQELNDKQLIPGTAEYNYALIYAFEAYGIKGNLVSTIPMDYYLYFYNYKWDPKFWVDVLFEYPFEQRVGGRNFEILWTNYKWDKLTFDNKLWGMGYSTLMNGSILVEKDFVQQIYTYGYSGFVLLMMPYLLLVVFGVSLIFKKFKKLFRFDIVVYGTAITAGFMAGFTSGHTFDQFLTSIFIAFLIGVLYKKIVEVY